ncbi:uncharacterized protein KZ484_017761 [Pholidichthys leucotaenia]
MGPLLERKCFKLSMIFFLLAIITFIAPIKGFILKNCRISYNKASCVKNKLSAVPQDIPPTVTGLDLSANKLLKIEASDFRNLCVLIQLDLNRNNIKHIDSCAFANLTALEKLNLNNNQLMKLEENVFAGLSCLVELRINSNHIKQVESTAFKSLTSLSFLDLSHNKLQQITNAYLILQHLPNLKELVFKNNGLTTFRSDELTNSSLALKALDLSQNSFSIFTLTANIFPNLTRFNIGGFSRKQHMIWDVKNMTFLSRVSSLDISGLQITLDDMKTLLQMVNSSLTILRMNSMKHSLTTLINVSCTIPTMSKLQLQRNKIGPIGPNKFKLCINVTELDLADNTITKIDNDSFTALQSLRILSLSRNKLTSVPTAIRNLPKLAELDLSTNKIHKLRCDDFTNLTRLRQLSLYQNSIQSLEECVFKDLAQLEVLKLQNSKIAKLNGAFSRYLPKLKQLHLNQNKLTHIHKGEFNGLQSLQKLSLQENQIEALDGESFIGLTNLTNLLLQQNSIRKIINLTFSGLINLRRLDLSSNRIKYENSSALTYPPFSQLSKLEELLISGQKSKQRNHFPQNFLKGLKNLLRFDAGNSQLLHLHSYIFNSTPQLKILDINANELRKLSGELFHPIPNLKSLYISGTNLHSLDLFIDANLTKLEFLQGKRNSYQVITEKQIRSLPALLYMDLQGNSFYCDCDNEFFITWAKQNQTQVFDAYNFTCNYPPSLTNTKLFDFDIRQCSLDIGLICFVSTTCTTLCFMVASFIYHFMRWHLVCAYYLFLAWLSDKKHKNKQAPNQYDAFISYNTHDEPWVIRELLPKLEGEQGWKLCLHHRDFEPGKPIIDNITDAIYGSRKTICVISHRYLESEWCSREIQAASFRLFDEKKDVLILVFLEDIPTFLLSPFHRMRKVLKKKTYLSWPRTVQHPELFWEKLRQALITGKDLNEERLQLTVPDTILLQRL